MRITKPVAIFACLLPLPALIGGPAVAPPPRAIDARFAPYSPDPDHSWNRLHQALFVRETGGRRVHTTDPLLYRGGTFLLEGESHRKALTALDQFLDARVIDDPIKRLFLQHDLWAAFDYAAWYPDEWVHKSKYEPAAVALRNRLAKAVGRLALDNRELAALPDNYALALKSKQYPIAHDPKHPERPFLPADLFDPTGPWVRFHETTPKPMTQRHFDGAGGRAAHVVFLRLPDGRAATERYLKGLRREAVTQFPPGTMVAMVRQALTVDAAAKVRVTSVTELVQIRVYRRIPADPEANLKGDFGEQDVYEFVLDREKLFAGQHGLKAASPDDPAEPLFERDVGADPFEGTRRPFAPETTQLKTCIQCHQAPGVRSILSMERGLRGADTAVFRTYTWDVEMKYTVQAKTKRYDWGLLQGKLEAK